MPSRENAASRRRRRANNTEKKKRVAEKEKAKEDAIAKRGPEEKGIDEILAELDKEAKEKEVKPTEEKIQQPKARIFGTLSAHPTKDLLLLFGGELCDGQNTKGSDASLFIFGGEFTSPTGNQFYHYNEFWRLPLNVPFAEMAWEKLDSKGGPSPRSGHRMVMLKKTIVVFGGFHFNNKSSPKYFNDVHVFDLETYKWSKVLVCGGYSMARTKGESFAGHQHADMWFLEENGDGGDGGESGEGGKKACPWTWSKVKSTGVVPNLKSGAAMAGKDDRAYSFGGTEDVEDEDSIESTCFNDLYTVMVGKKSTWHSLESPEAVAAAAATSTTSASTVPPSSKSCPSPRMNASLCVTGNGVYIFGGQIEIGSRSMTLSDLYTIPIGKGGKLGSWALLHGNEASSGGWAEEDSSSSDGSDSDEDEEVPVVVRKKKGGPKKGPNPLKARLAATPAAKP